MTIMGRLFTRKGATYCTRCGTRVLAGSVCVECETSTPVAPRGLDIDWDQRARMMRGDDPREGIDR